MRIAIQESSFSTTMHARALIFVQFLIAVLGRPTHRLPYLATSLIGAKPNGVPYRDYAFLDRGKCGALIQRRDSVADTSPANQERSRQFPARHACSSLPIAAIAFSASRLGIVQPLRNSEIIRIFSK